MEEKPLAVRAQISSFNGMKNVNEIMQEIFQSTDEVELGKIIDMPCMNENYLELAKVVLLKLNLKKIFNQISNEIVIRIKIKKEDLPIQLYRNLYDEPLILEKVKLVLREEDVYVFMKGKLGIDTLLNMIDSPSDLLNNTLN